ncbi:YqaJ viral recombinase family protein [Clostridium botulinum]|uniref:YqaJ n=1 Tax=Clostridium botulinum (strain 657 / Type Ba4) TaxID=515621 RepID=A0A3F2ZYL1_CLOB6|nr:YqaJ viral recombinase family protein [Clostridium botulinum]ACQ52820.1 putative YqaJ [Clostridium botulinum Ba4 str. 657]AXG94044.1 endonuclease [Clostridium botulinum]MBY6756971.1 YqaJ viral recombinase family protein [Clostridium botulinum]RFM20622.1 endonuclease [Clostridium botulinum]
MVEFIEDKNLFPNVKVIFDTRKDDEARTKWLSQRCNSIGGSEIAKIAGFSKYGSSLTIFNEKLGFSEKFKGNINTKFGNRMEPIIREWVQEDFEKDTGIKLTTYEYPYMMIHKEYEYFSANIDGLAKVNQDYKFYENLDTGEIKFISKDELIGIEIKTASEFLSKMWQGEEIPDEYYCQCQWYMGITGLKYFLIIYLLGKEVKWKVVPRNDGDIKALFEIGESFWNNNILKKIPPMPVGLHCETKDILHQQALDNDIEVAVTENKLEKYKNIGEQIKNLEKEKEQLKQLIYLDLGDSKNGSDGLYKVSRYEVKRDKLDTKTFKEKYPVTYAAVLNGQTEYVNMRITKCK